MFFVAKFRVSRPMAQTSEDTFCYSMANIILDFVVIQGKLLLKLNKSFGTIITFLDKLLPVILYAILGSYIWENFSNNLGK